MLEKYIWHQVALEKETQPSKIDENCPFNQFREKGELKLKDELLIGASVQIEGDELEQAGEDFVDALHQEARKIDGKSKVKTIKAKALRALARQTQEYMGRMGYKLIAASDEWPK